MQFGNFLNNRLTLLVLILISLNATAVMADEKSRKEKQLQSLQSKISELKKSIDTRQDEKSLNVTQLRHIENRIGDVSKKIRDMEKEINHNEDALKVLRGKRKKEQQQLQQQHDMLAQKIYTAYTLGKQEKIKLLFSQNNPASLQRNLVYYQYFSAARAKLINDVKRSIATILDTEEQANRVSETLKNNYQTLKEQQSKLHGDRIKRKKIISILNHQLEKQGRHLKQMEQDARQLQDLITSLTSILTDIPEPDLSQHAFAALKGKLAWPVKGKVKHLFGRQKLLSALRWKGIIIEAPSGRYVSAISRGRVAFSDWLRGFGNLIIIDHGNDYLSLYGHHQALFKSAGEWVEPGDIIGSVGNSGGQAKPGLYFEIRKEGEPQNPVQWFEKSAS